MAVALGVPTFPSQRRSSSLENVLEEGNSESGQERGAERSVIARKKGNVGSTLALDMNSDSSNLSTRPQTIVLRNGMMTNSEDFSTAKRAERSHSPAPDLTLSMMSTMNALGSIAQNLLISERGASRESHDSPPPRPPKKKQGKAELPKLAAPVVGSQALPPSTTGADLTDAERRMLIPPKPARRNIVTVRPLFISNDLQCSRN